MCFHQAVWFGSVQFSLLRTAFPPQIIIGGVISRALGLTPFTFSLGNNTWDFSRFWEAAFINWHTVSYTVYLLTFYTKPFPMLHSHLLPRFSHLFKHTLPMHTLWNTLNVPCLFFSVCWCSVSLQERDTQCLGKGCKQRDKRLTYQSTDNEMPLVALILSGQSVVCTVLTPPFFISSFPLEPQQRGFKEQDGAEWFYW